MDKNLESLYNAVSSKFDVGDYNSFQQKMQTPEDRKKFYDAVSQKGLDLGDYNEYENRLKKKEVSTNAFAMPSMEQPEDFGVVSGNDYNEKKVEELRVKRDAARAKVQDKFASPFSNKDVSKRDAVTNKFNEFLFDAATLGANALTNLGVESEALKSIQKQAKEWQDLETQYQNIKDAVSDTKEYIPLTEYKTGKPLIEQSPKEFADVKRKAIDENYKEGEHGSVVNAAKVKQTQDDFTMYMKALDNKIAYEDNALKSEGFYDKFDNAVKQAQDLKTTIEKPETAKNPTLYNELVNAFNAKQEEIQNLQNDSRFKGILAIQDRQKQLKDDFVKELKKSGIDAGEYQKNQDAIDKAFEESPILKPIKNALGKAGLKILSGALQTPKIAGDVVTSKELPIIGQLDDYLYNLGTSLDMRAERNLGAETKMLRNISQKYVDYGGYRLLVDDDNKAYSVRNNDFGKALVDESKLLKEYNDLKEKPEIQRDFSGKALMTQGLDVLADIGALVVSGRGLSAGLGKISKLKDATRANIAGASAIYAQSYADFYKTISQDENLTESEKARYAMANGLALALGSQYIGGFEKALANPNFRSKLIGEISQYKNQLLNGTASATQVAFGAAKKLIGSGVKNIAEEEWEEVLLEPLEQAIVDNTFRKATDINSYNIPSEEETKNTMLSTMATVFATSVLQNPYTKNAQLKDFLGQMQDMISDKNYDDIASYYTDLKGLKQTDASDNAIKAIKLAEKYGKGDNNTLIDLLFRGSVLAQNIEKSDSEIEKSDNKEKLKKIEADVKKILNGEDVDFYTDKDKEEPIEQPTQEETPTEEPKVEAAVIEIGGKIYEGKNHAEAILKAKEDGQDISSVDRQGQGKFRLSDGTIIDRAKAKEMFGQDRSELLIEQDDAAKNANKEYRKLTRGAKSIKVEDVLNNIEDKEVQDLIKNDAEFKSELEGVVNKVINGEDLTEDEQKTYDNIGLEKAISKAEQMPKKKTAATETNTKVVGDRIVEEVQPVQDVKQEVEDKKAEIERRRQDIISRKSTPEEKFDFLENIPHGTIIKNKDGDAIIIRKKITKRGAHSYEIVPMFINEDGIWEENYGGLKIVEKKANGEFNINAELPQILTSNVEIILPTDDNYDAELSALNEAFQTNKEVAKEEPTKEEKKLQELAERKLSTDGGENWRQEFNKEKDPFVKSSILRGIAGSNTSEKAFNDILNIIEGMPEESNIAWEIANNPNSSKEVFEKAVSNKELQKNTTDENIQSLREKRFGKAGNLVGGEVMPKEISDLYRVAASLRFTLNALKQQMGGKTLVGKSKIEYENTKTRLDNIELKLSEYEQSKSQGKTKAEELKKEKAVETKQTFEAGEEANYYDDLFDKTDKVKILYKTGDGENGTERYQVQFENGQEASIWSDKLQSIKEPTKEGDVQINKKRALQNAEKIDKGSGSHVKNMSMQELKELASDMAANGKEYQDKFDDAQGIYNLTTERIEELEQSLKEQTKKDNQTSESGQLEEQKPNKVVKQEQPTEVPQEERTENDFANSNENYRIIVGDESFNDIIESGVVRTNAESKPKSKDESIIDLSNRPTAFPSFSRGKAAMSYAQNNPNHYIIVSEDKSIQPSTSGRHGKGETMFPTDENGKHLKELSGEKVKVYKHLGEGKYVLVYENGKVVNSENNKESNIAITPNTDENGQGNEKAETERLLTEKGGEVSKEAESAKEKSPLISEDWSKDVESTAKEIGVTDATFTADLSDSKLPIDERKQSARKQIKDYKITNDASYYLISTALEKVEGLSVNNIFDLAKRIAKLDNKPILIEHIAEAIQYEVGRVEGEKDTFSLSIDDAKDVLLNWDKNSEPANKTRMDEIGIVGKTYRDRINKLKTAKKQYEKLSEKGKALIKSFLNRYNDTILEDAKLNTDEYLQILLNITKDSEIVDVASNIQNAIRQVEDKEAIELQKLPPVKDPLKNRDNTEEALKRFSSQQLSVIPFYNRKSIVKIIDERIKKSKEVTLNVLPIIYDLPSKVSRLKLKENGEVELLDKNDTKHSGKKVTKDQFIDIALQEANNQQKNSYSISEAYHKAKEDGSNPELVKAVEELLGSPKTEQPKISFEDKVNLITDPKALNKQTQGTHLVTSKGKAPVEVKNTIKWEQAQIVKRLKNLQKLIDCE